MAYPTSLDSFSGFTSSHTLSQDNHAAQHNQEQAAIVALENKVGINASNDPNSIDYKLSTAIGNIATNAATITAHINNTSNPHSVTAAQVGLGNVNNTSDITKLKMVYPVGCLYTETTGMNPSTTFGFGTWSQVGQGEFLVGQKPADANFGTAGATGGGITHSHPLSDNGQAGIVPVGSTIYSHRVSTVQSVFDQTSTTTSANSGGNTPGPYGVGLLGSTDSQTTIPPFLVVYFWKRTA